MARYVQKIPLPVRLALPGSDPLAGFVSLSPKSEFRDGPETLIERLNSATRVLPFQSTDGTRLVTRAHILWLEVGRDVPQKYIEPPQYLVTREERVRMRLLGGEEVDGLLVMELPAEYNRASDFLNLGEDFFALRIEAGTRVMNKLHVLETRLFGASPRPAEGAAA